jgi:hypothetical protein
MLHFQMRTTITVDDELFDHAMELAPPGTDRSELIRMAIETFIEVEAGHRLAALGGKAPRMKPVRRRQAE